MNPASSSSRFHNHGPSLSGLSLLVLVAMALQIPAMRAEAVHTFGRPTPQSARQFAEPIAIRTQTQPKRQGEVPTAARLAERMIVVRRAAGMSPVPVWTSLRSPERPPVRVTSLPPPANA